jgi:hypothetical protein
MKRMNSVVMKRLAAAAVAAGLMVGGGLASAAPASADTSQVWAFVYSQTNYGGASASIYKYDNNYHYFNLPVNSVINHTSRTLCGDAGYPSIEYDFWPGGAWSYIGSPFSSSHPMKRAYFCN